jgi:hypothetical protein
LTIYAKGPWCVKKISDFNMVRTYPKERGDLPAMPAAAFGFVFSAEFGYSSALPVSRGGGLKRERGAE